MAEQWILSGLLMAWMEKSILFKQGLRQSKVDKAHKILSATSSLKHLIFLLRAEQLVKKLEQEKPK